MMIIRRLLILSLTYAAALIAGFLLYLGLIASPVLGGVSILFYRGIAIALIAAPLFALLLAIAGRRMPSLDLSTVIGATALSLAFNICFLIVFPVTFDRSVTMFLLARIEQQDGQLDARDLEHIFVADYLRTLRQIDRRVEEQSLSGNIVVADGRIRLTPQGKRLMAGARTVGRWFGADRRFVHPQFVETQAPAH
ncbi:hypothetical protein [Sphingobium sp. Z007]|uniref:hypothetical protein n=1 Tax=Sphingobium sp. Z007 TaxID=627495 RepID=UPI000B49FF1E|nr:hypothetical protein [Sphingobium sp. Z007]